MLPFTVKYIKSFDRTLSHAEKKETLRVIEEFIHKNPIEYTEGDVNSISYDELRSQFGRGIISTVEKGIFTITHQNNKSIITFEIFMYHYAFFFPVAAFLLSCIPMINWVVIICFLGFAVINWGITVLRYSWMFTKVYKLINQSRP